MGSAQARSLGDAVVNRTWPVGPTSGTPRSTSAPAASGAGAVLGSPQAWGGVHFEDDEGRKLQDVAVSHLNHTAVVDEMVCALLPHLPH